MEPLWLLSPHLGAEDSWASDLKEALQLLEACGLFPKAVIHCQSWGSPAAQTPGARQGSSSSGAGSSARRGVGSSDSLVGCCGYSQLPGTRGVVGQVSLALQENPVTGT